MKPLKVQIWLRESATPEWVFVWAKNHMNAIARAPVNAKAHSWSDVRECA